MLPMTAKHGDVLCRLTVLPCICKRWARILGQPSAAWAEANVICISYIKAAVGTTSSWTRGRSRPGSAGDMGSGHNNKQVRIILWNHGSAQLLSTVLLRAL